MMKLLLFVAVVATVACTNDVTAPDVPECVNELNPPSFRLVMLNGDTTPRVTNRYAIPHKNIDTLVTPFIDGTGFLYTVDRYPVGYCITVFDSTLLHTRKAEKWIP